MLSIIFLYGIAQRCGVSDFSVGESPSSMLSGSAMQFLTKLMGLLLTSIVVQMLITGLLVVIPVLAASTGS